MSKNRGGNWAGRSKRCLFVPILNTLNPLVDQPIMVNDENIAYFSC